MLVIHSQEEFDKAINPLATVNAYEYSQVFAKDPKTIHKTLDRL